MAASLISIFVPSFRIYIEILARYCSVRLLFLILSATFFSSLQSLHSVPLFASSLPLSAFSSNRSFLPAASAQHLTAGNPLVRTHARTQTHKHLPTLCLARACVETYGHPIKTSTQCECLSPAKKKEKRKKRRDIMSV